MNDQMTNNNFSSFHIKRFLKFKLCSTTQYQNFDEANTKLFSTQREIYYTDNTDRLKTNDIVLRKVNEQWQITAKIDSEYGYHHINCQNALEADLILSSLIRQRLHQMSPLFEIECKNFIFKDDNKNLKQISVCRLISPASEHIKIFEESQSSGTTSKYKVFCDIIEKPKLIRKPSIKLLTRYGSKELIQFESKNIEKQEKFKSLIQK